MKNIFALLVLSLSLSACPQKVKESAKPVPGKQPTRNKVANAVEKVSATKKIVVTPGKTYTIKYPEGWELKPKFMGTDSMALSMPEGPKDLFRENINVVLEKVAVKDTQAYYDANLRAMERAMTDFKKISKTDIKLASGIPAINLVYTHRMGQISAKNRAVFIYQKGTGYVITATAKPDTFTKFNPQFEEIIQSFTVK